MATNGLNKI